MASREVKLVVKTDDGAKSTFMDVRGGTYIEVKDTETETVTYHRIFLFDYDTIPNPELYTPAGVAVYERLPQVRTPGVPESGVQSIHGH